MESGATDDGGRPALVAVLAGGRGSRLGVGKASVELCGRPLIAYPLQAARAAGLDAVVVAKRASELPRLGVPIVHEPDAPRHPLCGIVAALRQTQAPVVAVGCDMPFLTGELLAWLARGGEDAADGEGAAGGRAPQATAARVGGHLQPLPALYCPADLPALESALAGERSLRATLAELDPCVLDEDTLRAFGEPERLCSSVNDARDLRTAEDRMGRSAWMGR